MRFPGNESSTLEFKRELPSKDQIVKTVIGFCNQFGGKIAIGVSDDGGVLGLDSNIIEEALEKLDRVIYDACEPHIIPRLYIQNMNNKNILIIEISEGMNKPYYRRSKGKGKGTYVRLGRHTMLANEDIIKELEWQSEGIEYEDLPVYQATVEDLDEKKITEFLSQRKNHGTVNINEEVLRSYDFVVYEQTKLFPTNLGVLLFGRAPQKYLSEAMIICSHFTGLSGREAIATIDCVGTIIDQFKQAFAFILERLYHSFTIEGLKREEKLEIPEVAIREVLLNAIVHRNYHIKAPIKIAIYDNRVEFFSPGQFPGPIDVNNLMRGITYLRNPGICKVLREANYIEKLGTGFITLFKEYERVGIKAPSIVDGENYVKCILYRGIERVERAVLTDVEKIVEYLRVNNEISVKETVSLLSISRATASRRLRDMLNEGILIRHGHTKALRYKLKNVEVK